MLYQVLGTPRLDLIRKFEYSSILACFYCYNMLHKVLGTPRLALIRILKWKTCFNWRINSSSPQKCHVLKGKWSDPSAAALTFLTSEWANDRGLFICSFAHSLVRKVIRMSEYSNHSLEALVVRERDLRKFNPFQLCERANNIKQPAEPRRRRRCLLPSLPTWIAKGAARE